MKSVVLCEGPDDLWFIGDYLYIIRKMEAVQVSVGELHNTNIA